MFIKRLNPFTFDVFWNKGWDSWARLQRTKEGQLLQTLGKPIPKQLYLQFRNIVNKQGKRRQKQLAGDSHA